MHSLSSVLNLVHFIEDEDIAEEVAGAIASSYLSEEQLDQIYPILESAAMTPSLTNWRVVRASILGICNS